MFTSTTYHLIGQILSLAVHAEKTSMVEEKLRDPHLPWLKLISTGSNHLVLPAVYIRLRETGLLPLLPDIISEHLENIFRLNLERNQSIIRQSEEINELLKTEGIPVLFLKGVGNIFDRLYSSHGERMIQDIDILVPEAHWIKSAELLQSVGYQNHIPYDAERISYQKHFPRLYRNAKVASIELHRFAVGSKYENVFSAKSIWEEKKTARELPSAFVMCDNNKIIHNFIHSQLEHQGHIYARIFLRNLYDQLLLSQRIDPYKTMQVWGKHPKKTAAYLEVFRKTFVPEDMQNKQAFSKTGLYPLRHEIQLYSRLTGTIMQVAIRFFLSYIRKPWRALYNREVRISLAKKITSKSWYRKHLRSYRRYFGQV